MDIIYQKMAILVYYAHHHVKIVMVLINVLLVNHILDFIMNNVKDVETFVKLANTQMISKLCNV